MNLRQVRYFLAVCEERHFTRAARKCNVQQPSLTAAIKRLEREVGAPLFLRTSPVQLSDLAVTLQPLFAQIDELSARIGRIADGYVRLPSIPVASVPAQTASRNQRP
jgi:DNA-binding transcriptional LysR family regulator